MSGTRKIEGLKTQVLNCIESAYDKGYEVAKQDVVATGNKSEYERGLDDAEKAIKRVLNEPSRGGLYANEMQEIFGTKGMVVILLKYSISEIIEKIREYDEKKQLNERCETCKYQHSNRSSFPCCDCCDNDRWESKEDNKINVGEEIIFNGEKYIVINIAKYENSIVIMSGTNILATNVENVKKTGRKYPIADMLEGLKNEK